MESSQDINDGRTSATGKHAPSSYAIHGKIFLCSVFVVFAAVFLIVCFQSRARWLFHRQNRRRRRRRRRIREQLHSSSAPTAAGTSADASFTQGALDRSVLEKIPVFLYSSKDSNLTPLECAVCLSEFEDDEEGRVLPKCNHVFHVDCIDTWFRSKSICPLCRAPVGQARAEEFAAEPIMRTTEPGASASSSPARCPPKSNERQLTELVGILVETPRGFDDTDPGKPGSKSPCHRVESLKRLGSI